jgi:hypothetical protein
MTRQVAAAIGILLAWMLLDLVGHRLFLAPLYETTASLWRPFDQMSVGLIYAVTLVLIGVILAVYTLLVRPKSPGAGLALGALVGVLLGTASGFGTFVHMPIPLQLAWGWFILGWLKGLAAGAIVGFTIVDAAVTVRTGSTS